MFGVEHRRFIININAIDATKTGRARLQISASVTNCFIESISSISRPAVN